MNRSSPPITVSAIITVYNKATYLPATIRSLRRQVEDERKVEYVLVDDASTDNSVAVIRDQMDGAPHVQVVTNDTNGGPSLRLNQGVARARGHYLYFLDGDDIAVDGAMAGMLTLLQREQADVIYGKTRKGEPKDLLELRTLPVDSSAPYRISEQPLAYIMKGGFVRMSLMCERALFLQSGGADPRIFIQDESLPLRLCALSRRFIDWQAVVTLMPQSPFEAPAGHNAASKLSADKTQLHHDAFFAYAHVIEEVQESHPELLRQLYAKAVSAYWKFAKRQPRWRLLHPGFWRYLECKCLRPAPKPQVLNWMAAELYTLEHIRRPRHAMAHRKLGHGRTLSDDRGDGQGEADGQPEEHSVPVAENALRDQHR